MTTDANTPARSSTGPSWLSGEAGRGATDMLPMLLGYAPFAVVVGAAIAAQHDRLAAWTATGWIYGGAAHLAVLGALGGGSTAAVAIVIGLVVNARLLVYSATIVGPWRGERWWRQAVAAALLTDAIWAAATRRNAAPGTDAERRRYYFGSGATLWLGWVAMVSAATVAGSHIPVVTQLALAPPLCLIALVGPTLRDRAGRAAAAGAALVAIVPDRWLGGVGVLVAVAIGVIVGLFAERKAQP